MTATGPQDVRENGVREFVALPLQPAFGRSPFKVLLAKDLSSDLLKLVQGRVQTFVKANNGRLPSDDEWGQIIEINDLMDAGAGPPRKVNDILRNRLFQEMKAQAPGGVVTVEMNAVAKKAHLQLMQYESQIATMLAYSEGQEGLDANDLKKFFFVQKPAPLGDILRPTDPLANIDPNDNSGALSLVGSWVCSVNTSSIWGRFWGSRWNISGWRRAQRLSPLKSAHARPRSSDRRRAPRKRQPAQSRALRSKTSLATR